MDHYKTFLCSYRYEGAEWSFQIKALDQSDAERRLAVIRSWGRLDGELMMIIPAPLGFIARGVVAVRNWLRGTFP